MRLDSRNGPVRHPIHRLRRWRSRRTPSNWLIHHHCSPSCPVSCLDSFHRHHRIRCHRPSQWSIPTPPRIGDRRCLCLLPGKCPSYRLGHPDLRHRPKSPRTHPSSGSHRHHCQTCTGLPPGREAHHLRHRRHRLRGRHLEARTIHRTTLEVRSLGVFRQPRLLSHLPTLQCRQRRSNWYRRHWSSHRTSDPHSHQDWWSSRWMLRPR